MAHQPSQLIYLPSLHWYVALIYNPAACLQPTLKETASSPSAEGEVSEDQ